MDYNDYAAHRAMVRDEARTTAFQKAIAAQVKPGDVVLDVGAGSGVLSLFAAQAGAARVYAVERSPQAAAMAQHLVHANGFAEIVHILVGDVREVQLPEPVDVVVSEWMGTIGIDENMYGAVLWARDHFLKAEGGRVIPVSVTAIAAPVSTAQRVDAAFFADKPWGLDLAALGEPMVNDLMMSRRRVEPRDLASPARPMWKSTALTDAPDAVRQPARTTLAFKAGEAHDVTAIAMWFDADLGGGVSLTNAPEARDTHWGQMLLPLASRLSVAKGDTLNVEIAAWPVGPGPLMFSWTWRIGDGPASTLDTTGTHQGPPPDQGVLAMAADAGPPPRSAVSKFLAMLAMDPAKLADFLEDPEAVMADAKLTTAQIEAVKSQDADRIGMALYELGGVS